MNQTIIKSEKQYKNLLEFTYELMNSEPNTVELDTLEVLSKAIEQYEEIHYNIDDLIKLSHATLKKQKQD